MNKILIACTLFLASLSLYAGGCEDFRQIQNQYNRVAQSYNQQFEAYNLQASGFQDITRKMNSLEQKFMMGDLNKDEARKFLRQLDIFITMANKAKDQMENIWGSLDDLVQEQWSIEGSCQAQSYDFVNKYISPAMDESSEVIDGYQILIKTMEQYQTKITVYIR